MPLVCKCSHLQTSVPCLSHLYHSSRGLSLFVPLEGFLFCFVFQPIPGTFVPLLADGASSRRLDLEIQPLLLSLLSLVLHVSVSPPPSVCLSVSPICANAVLPLLHLCDQSSGDTL